MAFPPFMIALFIVGGLLIAVIVSFVAWIFFRKGKKSFPFLLYSVDGKMTTVQGAVKVDPTNKTNKKFHIAGTDQTLPIRAPSVVMGGVAYREIMYDQNGELQYVDRSFVKNKLEVSLLPEEKQIALSRIKENEKRYENPMGKAQAYMILSLFLLIFILLVGIVYSTISYVKVVNKMVQISEDNRESMKLQQGISQNNQAIVEQLAGITAALHDGKNITRTLS